MYMNECMNGHFDSGPGWRQPPQSTPSRRNIWSSVANYIPITYKASTECKLVIGQFRYYAGSVGPDIPSGGCITPFRTPKNFTRFSISLTVHGIWAILCWKLVRRCTPYFHFIQPIERSLKVKPPLENPKTFNRFLISLTVLEIWAILCLKLFRMRTPHSNFFRQ